MSVDPTSTFADNPRPVDGGLLPGRAGDALLRLAPAGYGDDNGQTPAGEDRLGAREISNIVFTQSASITAPTGFSSLTWVWGQFLDHDLDRTPGSGGGSAPIPVPTGDPVFDPDGTGAATISFTRAGPVSGTGTGPGVDNPRQHANVITAFIDGSQVYGSSQAVLDSLLVAGTAKLRLDANGLIIVQGASPVTGDVRGAENVALTAMHAVFAREHNRLVDELAAADPTLTTAELFEGARARVEAILQAVTYNEFLPILVGHDAIGAYEGYDPTVNPQIATEFATAVYRLGHSMLSPVIARIAEDGSTIAEGNLALRDAFFNNAALVATGVDPIMRGMASTRAQALDTFMVEDVRSFLSLGTGLNGGFDLAALNIQRGRDMGLPTYNAMRVALGLAPRASFAEITSDPVVAARLEAAYGDVNKIDLWVGGLAETPLPGGVLGEVFSIVLIDQFHRLRAGDPFWSEGRGFGGEELSELWSTTLSDVIARNSGVAHLQRHALLAYDRQLGTATADTLTGGEERDFIVGLGGDDVLFGQIGDDELRGGDGGDSLDGGAGDDILLGEAGDDTLVGGPGDDLLEGGDGEDVLRGGDDRDTLRGGQGADSLLGAVGDDLLEGETGNDTLDGGDGADTLRGAEGADVLTAGNGDDLLEGGTNNDTLNGDAGADSLSGGDGADSLLGGGGNDLLEGEADNDTLNGGAGVDTLRGGDGADLLLGGADDDLLEGGAGVDTQNGGDGADTLRGAQGADFLVGGNGNDLLEGGTDNDTLNGDAGADSLTGGDGADSLLGGGGDDLLEGEAGVDTLIGGAGADTLRGGDGADSLLGSVDNDLLEGGADNDTLDGGAGADTLRGGEGTDSLFGWDGNDLLEGEAGADTLNGGAGADTLRGGSNADSLLGGADDDLLEGEAGDDTLNGGAGADTLRGGDGSDTMLGWDGSDLLEGEAGNDTLNGGASADTLRGGEGADSLFGGDQNDLLEGGAGADTLDGGAGNDVLIGAAGVDRLRGGTGVDVFLFEALSDSGPDAATQDVIGDFQQGVDRIDLSVIDALPLTADEDAFVYVGQGPFTAAGQLRHVTVGATTTVFVTVTDDLSVAMSVRLNSVTSLSAADFVL